MSTGLSAWCHPAPGTRHSAAQCGMCQMQLDKHPERTCSCGEHRGESSTVEREIPQMCDNGASPQGAQTPAGSDHRSLLETNGG